ncbi:polyphosphate kinase 1 [bacterium]|nr:polyphosphate kinase 1 [bacterium]
MTRKSIPLDSPEAFFNRELSWLSFARRVAAQAEDPGTPLLERVKFAGIVGMLHDEFFMKRISGLKRQIAKRSTKISLDGRTPDGELAACRAELLHQRRDLERIVLQELRPALESAGLGIRDYADLAPEQQAGLRAYFVRSVRPILTLLAVDSEHPFPFVSNLGLNLAILLPQEKGDRRVVRVKVPDNRPRWVPIPDGSGFVPLEQLIIANLDLVYTAPEGTSVHLFRVTRGADGDEPATPSLRNGEALREPGSIIRQVSNELKARRFAGVVRLEVDRAMPKDFRKWLAKQCGVTSDDVYTTRCIAVADLARLDPQGRPELRFPAHHPSTHARLRNLDPSDPTAIFREIDRGDILVHHPYDDFDTSVLRFIESAAEDPAVLAIKLTIYRTSQDSPIVRALTNAARRGKQVAVLVEITARFDEAPNIAWGKQLEREGVHVAYGVEKLKTHVKLALVVREEGEALRSYAHIGTGNYHSRTARLYEDLGVLTSNPEICDDITGVFHALTGAIPLSVPLRLLVAPLTMRQRFTELIHREIEHAKAGRPAGIHAKMNQLQDPELIRELYRAGQAGVPVTLNVRGLCCLRPGVPGLSENIRVHSVVGRFLEHSRLCRFTNGGDTEYFLGSADWMKRNLNSRVEAIVPVLDDRLRRELDHILDIYADDNASAWDGQPDGTYVLRTPAEGEAARPAQLRFQRAVPVRSAVGGPGAPAQDGDGRDEARRKAS